MSFLSASEIGTGGAKTLPGEYYASLEIFQQELDRIFYRRWICAGREEDVPEPGDYLVRNIGTESVLVTRDREGEVRALHNVCRHRGSRLCTEPRGRFSSAIRCPYHAWTYGLDGSLRAAPFMDGVPGFDPQSHGLHPVALASWEGFLFVSLADDPEPFEQAYQPLLGKFPGYNLPHLRVARQIDYDPRANWKLIFENYSECLHCPTIHRALVKQSPAESGRNDLVSGPFLGGYMDVTSESGSLSATGRACAIPVGELPEADRRRVYYYSLFPNVLLSLHADYVMVHMLWPIAPDRTLIECRWLFHAEAAAQPAFDPDDAVQFWDRVNREDWHVCELCQAGVSSRAYTPGPYSARESLSAAFDREVLRALGATP